MYMFSDFEKIWNYVEMIGLSSKTAKKQLYIMMKNGNLVEKSMKMKHQYRTATYATDEKLNIACISIRSGAQPPRLHTQHLRRQYIRIFAKNF